MRVYVDTMLWIYHFENDPVFGPSATRTMSQLERSGDTVLSSLFVLSEVLVGPKRKGEQFRAAQLRRFFLSSAVTLAPYTPDAVDLFSNLRSNTRIKPLDALHLAVAASANADFFVTTDAQLLRLTVPGIDRICSPEVLQNALTP